MTGGSPLALAALVGLALLPGLALAIHLVGAEADTDAPDAASRDPLCLLAAVLGAGLACYVVGFWLLRAAPIGLGGLAAAIALASLAALVVWRGRLRRTLARLRWGASHRAALFAALAIAAVRLAPAALVPVAPGADMSMHSYMARLILEADGVPASYAPILPIREFGAYAAGLPSLGALAARLTGASAAGGALAIACLAHLLVSLALYAFARQRASSPAALCAMLLATLATRDPQHHFDWGGNPTVLSLALCVLGLQLVDRLDGARWRGALAVAPVAFAAAALTHSVIPYALVFILPAVLVVRMRRRAAAEWWRVIARGALLGGLTLALMAPYLGGLALEVSEAERQWIARWQRLPVHVPPGPAWLLPLGLVAHVAVRLGVVFTVWLAAAIAVRRWARFALGEELSFSAVVLLLVLNAFVWVLPGSYAIYPDRITLLLVPPAARILAGAWDALAPRLARARLARRLLQGAVAASLIPGLVIWWLLALGEVSVTRDDLAAIAFVARSASRGEVIENNYGDAGIWIPALALRPVRSPHVNVVYLDEVAAWRRAARPRLLYLGARRVYEADSPYTEAALRARPDRYREIFRSGAAAVYALSR
jgi:hypothetical protein